MVGAFVVCGIIAATIYAVRSSFAESTIQRARTAPIRSFGLGFLVEVVLGAIIGLGIRGQIPRPIGLVFVAVFAVLVFPGTVLGGAAIARTVLEYTGRQVSMAEALTAGVVLIALVSSLPVYSGAAAMPIAMFGVGSGLLVLVRTVRTTGVSTV